MPPMNFDWLQQPGGMSLQNPVPAGPGGMGMSLSGYGAPVPGAGYGGPAAPQSFGTPLTAFAGTNAPATAAAPQGMFGGMFDNFLNKQTVAPNGAVLNEQGWGGTALAAGQGLFNAFLGMKQYGLYKDQLNESKKQFGLNYEAQRQTTNSALEDRQRARVASNSGAYQSVGDYMQQNSIKGA